MKHAFVKRKIRFNILIMANVTTHPPIFVKVCFSIEHFYSLDKTPQLSFIKIRQAEGQICKTQIIINIFFKGINICS